MADQLRRWGRPDPMADPPSPSRLWNLPNALTMLRLLLVPVFGWLLLMDSGTNATARWWAAAVFVVASITDLLDGAIARKRNLVTTFGKVADPMGHDRDPRPRDHDHTDPILRDPARRHPRESRR
jgi:hypothetical protein